MMPNKQRCVLCGIRYATEIHHIIPVCAGGDNSEENLIPVCSACHSTLTPNSLLTKAGLRNNIRMNEVYELFAQLWEMMEKEKPAGGPDVLDVFEKWENTVLPALKDIIIPSRKSINSYTRKAILNEQG